MSETSQLEPEVELEPMCLDTVLVLILLTAWCITFIIGILICNAWIGFGSFFFFLLAIGIRKTAKEISVEDSVNDAHEAVEILLWIGDKLALYTAVLITIFAIGLMILLLASIPESTGHEPGLERGHEWLHMIAMSITMLSIIVFGSIAKSYEYRTPSCLLLLTGFLLIVLLVPVVWYVALLYSGWW